MTPKLAEYPDMRAVRNGYGLSRRESALIMGISLDDWGRIERGETHDPDNAVIYRLRARRYLAGNPERLPDPLVPYEKPIDDEPWAQPVEPTPEMVADARRWLELSMEECAKRMNVKLITWRNWERGVSQMPLNRWLGLLKAAGHSNIVPPAPGPKPAILADTRYEYYLTKGEAAELAGVSAVTWGHWERGTKTMPAERWTRFLEALEARAQRLAEEE
jgi:transcriptional regulator with XRE-family HTH domain